MFGKDPIPPWILIKVYTTALTMNRLVTPREDLACAHACGTGNKKRSRLLPGAIQPPRKAHDKAGEEVDELEGANAALGGQRAIRASADHEQNAHAYEPKNLDAIPAHQWVVNQGC